MGRTKNMPRGATTVVALALTAPLLSGCVIYNSPEEAHLGHTSRPAGQTLTIRPLAQPARNDEPARTAAAPAPVAPVKPAPPAQSAPPPPSTPAPSSALTHIGMIIEVQKGDTLPRLSHKYGVSISEILTANNMNSLRLRPGQRLIIPKPEARS